MFCTKCGKKITSGAEFCGFCGTPITPEQEEIRDSNQNSNEAQSKYSSDWSDNNNEQYDSRLDRRKKHEPPQTKKDNKNGLSVFILILIPILVFGGVIMGFEVMVIPAVILTILIGFPLSLYLASSLYDAIVSMLGKMKVFSTILLIPLAIVMTWYWYQRGGIVPASVIGLGSVTIYCNLWFGTEKKNK